MKKKIILTLLVVLLALTLFACKDKNVDKTSDIRYKINLSEGSDNTFSCAQTTTIKNVYASGLDNLVFNLYANAYSEEAVNKAYTEKLTSYGGIKILTVSVNGEKATYNVEGDGSFLSVAIPETALNKEITVDLNYTLTLPVCNLRMGVNGDLVKLTSFYPQLAVFENGSFRRDVYTTKGDPFFSDVADYEVTITAGREYMIASSGSEAVSESTLGETTQTRKYNATLIRDFALILDKNLSKASATVGNTEVMYYYYEDEKPQDTLKYAVDAVEVFSEKFGTYPYETLSVVMTDFADAGMEFGRLVFIADDISDLEDTIVHEIAHQWWYGMVGNDSINEAFLDEGLATFSTLYYYKQIYGQEKYKKKFKEVADSYILYERIQDMRNTGADLSINKSIYDFTDYQYDMLVYKKGAMMFASLMETMGEEKFTKALCTYVKDNRYCIAATEDLIKALSGAYGADISGYVNGWLGSQIKVTMLSA
ncbi:MAG TPA: M1 family metallopeptidase [Clostridia bacterium]|nr:M1 family metallopeptidase [Clostridia bacterium]